MKYTCHSKSLLADHFTPVGLYGRLRDLYPGSLLLESTDSHGSEGSTSILCLDELEQLEIQPGTMRLAHGKDVQNKPLEMRPDAFESAMQSFVSQIEVSGEASANPYSGVYGYTSFEAVSLMEEVPFATHKPTLETPLVRYGFYRFLIVIDHFHDQLQVIEHVPEGESSQMEELLQHLNHSLSPQFTFQMGTSQTHNIEPEDFKKMVEQGKAHCQRGDVFQVVVSRRFQRSYQGDDLNLYRALRSVNPSPFLFYFDLKGFRIMGSSPEAQLIVEDREAEIHPIAGTYPRSGHDGEDLQKAKELADDPKENAEHVMLVDLARNDLNRHCKQVEVSKFQEAQFFSHVIHLVSRVNGQLMEGVSELNVFAGTFPAGTLSGAPKVRALEIISELEPTHRGPYGGAIGFFGLNGSCHHAIIIRSFVSQQNILTSQAGAGVVIGSDPQKELEEVNHKLGALEKALKLAETL